MSLRFPDAYSERLAEIESSKNPLATNPSGAKGLFQIMPRTAKEYGVNNPFNIEQQFAFEKEFRADNKRYVEGKLGRNISPGEQYLAHQQGMGGAVKLLSNPEGNAADTVGKQRVLQNGGHEGMSNQEFANIWINKFEDSPLIAPSIRHTSGIQVASADPNAGAELLHTSMSGQYAASFNEAAPDATSIPQRNPSLGTKAYNAPVEASYDIDGGIVTVEAGDTLTEIFMEHMGLDAQAAYKEALEYAEENGFDANVIQVGQKIDLSGDISPAANTQTRAPVAFETTAVTTGITTSVTPENLFDSLSDMLGDTVKSLTELMTNMAEALGVDDYMNAPDAPSIEATTPPPPPSAKYANLDMG
jgi:hypothetical protein